VIYSFSAAELVIAACAFICLGGSLMLGAVFMAASMGRENRDLARRLGRVNAAIRADQDETFREHLASKRTAATATPQSWGRP
jgi:hypothetical protein